MVVFSTLRRRCFVMPGQLLSLNSRMNNVLKRHGGHGNVLEIQGTSFDYAKAKDLIHFYSVIAFILYGSIIVYANCFIGSATLAEIPEGYRPEHWEYHKHPITRFIQRYLSDDPQKNYEQFLHYLYEEDEMQKMRLLDIEIGRIMKKRKDYQAYFYRPLTVPANIVRQDKEDKEPMLYNADHLTTSNFPTNLGPKDSDLADEFPSVPTGVED